MPATVRLGYCEADGCNNRTSQRSTNRWSRFCCNTCASDHVVAARKVTWLRKYGVDNPVKSSEIRAKISKGVHRFMENNGIACLRKTARDFSFQPSLPDSLDSGTSFYVYLLLDPRKPGDHQYGRWKFDYEPFYVGKGKGDRATTHIRKCNSASGNDNRLKSNIIKKIMRETGENPIILVKRKNLTEAESFNAEAAMIHSIGRRDEKDGPLANHSRGGEGVSGNKWSKAACKRQSKTITDYFARRSPEEKKEALQVKIQS